MTICMDVYYEDWYTQLFQSEFPKEFPETSAVCVAIVHVHLNKKLSFYPLSLWATA